MKEKLSELELYAYWLLIVIILNISGITM